MLLKVNDDIAECLERAARLREQAERAGNPRMREDLLDAEQRWLHLAESYRFVEQAERFIAHADARKGSADDPSS